MKRLLPLVVVAMIGCSSGDSSSTTTLTSDDGRAVLEIPDGALPDGVELRDISITSVPENERPALEATSGDETLEATVLAAYRLEPAGTEFNSPVTLRVSADQGADGELGYLSFLESEDGHLTQPASNLIVDPETQRITAVEVEIPHFSLYIWAHTELVYGFRWVPPPMDTEDQVDIGIVATLNLDGTFCYRLARDAAPVRKACYTLESSPYVGEFSIRTLGPISPVEVLVDEETTEDVVAVRETFTCSSPGEFLVWGLVKLVIDDIPLQMLDGDGNVLEEDLVELTGEGFLEDEANCLAPTSGGEDCDHAHECGAGRLCGDGRCKDDSGSMPCSSDAECGGTRPVCESVNFQKQGDNMRCADCRDNSQCSGVRDICVNNHCVDCDVDSDCASNICTPAKICGECREDEDCPGAGTCVEGQCQECASDDDCTGALGVCGEDGECVQCASDSDCSAPLDRCRMGQCNSCVNDNDCPSLALPSCNASGCSPCDGDFDCDGDYTCESAGLRNACTLDCNGDGDCDGGQKCISGRCAQCESNGDCPASASICGPDGHCFECDSSNPCTDGRLCRVSTGNCVHCLNDDDCTDPGLPKCSFNACTAE